MRKRILFVEDRPEERARIKDLLERELEGKVAYYYVAEDLDGAMIMLDEESNLGTERVVWDGVISDLMFPKFQGAKEHGNGIQVVLECQRQNIPVVICSSVGHDNQWEKGLIAYLGVEIAPKDWRQALELLLEKIG